jgi:probable HAF family extracellular repeat protein
MKRATQMMGRALLGALVVAFIATAGWSQSLTWLGTLGGNRSEARGVSADGRVVVGWSYNAAGRDRAFRWTASGGMQDLGTLGGNGAGLLAFPPTAPWWSAGLATPQGCDHAFRWTASGGMQDLGTLGGRIGARLWVFPPTAPWWSAGLTTPQGRGVPFAGRRWAACKASARWAAMEHGFGCFRRRLRGGRPG